MPLTAQVVGVF